MTSSSEQARHVSAITLFVEDLEATRAFYETVFELPVHHADEVSAVFALATLLSTSSRSRQPAS